MSDAGIVVHVPWWVCQHASHGTVCGPTLHMVAACVYLALLLLGLLVVAIIKATA